MTENCGFHQNIKIFIKSKDYIHKTLLNIYVFLKIKQILQNIKKMSPQTFQWHTYF